MDVRKRVMDGSLGGVGKPGGGSSCGHELAVTMSADPMAPAASVRSR